MALNKFEKHIREQLTKREIHPSKEAWNKVMEQLGTPSKSNSKKILWYGIAASFTGLLIISLIFYKAEEQSSIPAMPDSEVVDMEVESKIHGSESNEKKIDQSDIELVDGERDLEKEIKKTSVDFQKTQKFSKNANRDTLKGTVANTYVLENENTWGEDTLDSPEEIIAAKVNEIVAQVEFLEQSSTQEISDMEIDSLLRKAQQEIMEEKLFREDGKVDAMALLTDVEEELDQSFRDQIFEKLKTGFLKVRTAVADRNN